MKYNSLPVLFEFTENMLHYRCLGISDDPIQLFSSILKTQKYPLKIASKALFLVFF